mmetsp:Transcript_6812/g.12858  ORF Transcript_6812/g.12858 Transcript_6812/m.12858 type:complete len:207 (-) Transcript_6812:265-885(-)
MPSRLHLHGDDQHGRVGIQLCPLRRIFGQLTLGCAGFEKCNAGFALDLLLSPQFRGPVEGSACAQGRPCDSGSYSCSDSDSSRRQFQTVDSYSEDVSSSSDTCTSDSSTCTDSKSSDKSHCTNSSENISDDNSDAPSEAEQHAITIAPTLVEQLPVARVCDAPTAPEEAPPLVEQLWDWFCAAAPTSIRQYRSKFHSDGFNLGQGH